MTERGFLSRLLDTKGEVDRRAVEGYVEQLKSEKIILESVVDRMAEAVMVVGADGRVRLCNVAFRLLLGLSSVRVGDPAAVHLRGEPLTDLYREARQTGGRIVGREFRIEQPVRRILRGSAIPLDNAADGPPVLALYLTDVTDWHEQEKRMRRVEKLAALTNMSATLAHELRNPLNSMSIHLQLHRRELARSNWDGDLESLEIVRQELHRLNDLLEDFLIATRPTRPQFQEADPRAILTSALDLLQPEIQRHRVDVVIEEPAQWPRMVVDETQLRRAAINLIKNATEAMSDGGTLTIAASSERDALVLRFRDTGCGMTQEQLARLFEPYYTTKQSGSGLGMVAVERIVSEHEGSIEVTSSPGAGTEVALRVPLVPPRQALLVDASRKTGSAR